MAHLGDVRVGKGVLQPGALHSAQDLAEGGGLLPVGGVRRVGLPQELLLAVDDHMPGAVQRGGGVAGHLPVLVQPVVGLGQGQ